MKHIIILSSDLRCISQITQWSKELKEETSVEVFKSLETFSSFINPVEDSENLQISEEKKASLYDQALIKEEGLHLMIIDHDLIPKESPVLFIQNLKEKFANPSFKKPENPTRYFLLSFETTTAGVEGLVSPMIDDLILKPMDHQLFLQKMAMALSDTHSTAGEFLYNQVVDAPIYMAKSSVIDELADFGVGIRSHKRMKDGVVVRLYSKIFGERQSSSLLARSYKSIDHPKRPGESLVYYNYFGIRSEQLAKIRRDLQSKQLKHAPPRRQLGSVEIEIFKRNKKHIAVIAFNEDLRNDLRQALEANFINVMVHSFSTVASFAKEIGMGTGSTKPNAVVAAAPITAEAFIGPMPEKPKVTFAFAGGLYNFILNHQDEVISIQSKNISYFDIEGDKLIAGGRQWLQYIHHEDVEEVQEFLNYVKNNGRGQIYARMLGSHEDIHYMRIMGQEVIGVVPAQIRILFTETLGAEGLKLWKSTHRQTAEKLKADQVSAVIVDLSGVSIAFDAWAEQFKGFLENARILSVERNVPVLVLIPEKLSAKLEELKSTFVSDVILSPHDRKILIDKLNINCPGLCNEFGVIIPVFEQIRADVRVGQQVQMEMASEFGIQIRTSKPLREGVFLRFFSPLFLDENHEGILARMFSAKQDDKNKSEFHNTFSFYGISDAFLKHIRKWIREAHIAQKEPKD
jgi:hypothetical protein